MCISHFVTFRSGTMWHSPCQAQRADAQLEPGGREMQREGRKKKEKKRRVVSINGGLVWKKKRLWDLFGSIWHLECINKQLFTLYKRQEGRVSAIQVLYEVLWHSVEYGMASYTCAVREAGLSGTVKQTFGACLFFCIRVRQICQTAKIMLW